PPCPSWGLALAASSLGLMPIVLLKRMFSVNCAGLEPKLDGIVISPGPGEVLKDPKLVSTMVGPVAPLAKDGRSLKMESPFRSVPVVMLKGAPEFATMNGLTRNPYGNATVPPKKRRWRTSNAARP